jgi:dTDP-4-dehydrorhamnose 3,5-epimerase
MTQAETPIPGVLLIQPQLFGDQRGFFIETWHRSRYQQLGLNDDFVQDNLAFSCKGVLRGLHFQNPNPQGKLVYVLQGEIYDVAVDIRKSSPAFGRAFGALLSAENHRQMYIPVGCAHGYLVVSDTALVAYKCTDFYSPSTQHALLWNDPDLRIDWPNDNPTLSDKDKQALALRQFDREFLFD